MVSVLRGFWGGVRRWMSRYRKTLLTVGAIHESPASFGLCRLSRRGKERRLKFGSVGVGASTTRDRSFYAVRRGRSKPPPYRLVFCGTFNLSRSLRVAKDVDPYGFVETDHNLFREIPLRALPWVGFDFADNT